MTIHADLDGLLCLCVSVVSSMKSGSIMSWPLRFLMCWLLLSSLDMLTLCLSLGSSSWALSSCFHSAYFIWTQNLCVPRDSTCFGCPSLTLTLRSYNLTSCTKAPGKIYMVPVISLSWVWSVGFPRSGRGTRKTSLNSYWNHCLVLRGLARITASCLYFNCLYSWII